ncbi:hypothetical protein [Botrimarina mediterranea]|uniref:hypothetical protein n=1 Tax=Botrimarina mediterranea TaxID=2528022 RepID=UPI0011882B18|nr:hypothetical protein K2D_32830 [Planctomycetes bacterium K2D]
MAKPDPEDGRWNFAPDDLGGLIFRFSRYFRPKIGPYRPASWDHDHCECCWKKIMEEGGDAESGWVTQLHDEDRWICDECFTDFREALDWRIEATKGH